MSSDSDPDNGENMRAAISFVLLALAGSALAQEKLSLSNIDVRTGIAFTIPAAAAQKLLPEGWEVNSPTSGPSQGANLTFTLLEQVSSQDAQGAALAPFQGVAIGVPARKKDGSAAGNMIVAGLFTAGGAPGAYGVYQAATGNVERRQRIDGDGKVLIEERWTFKSADGNAIDATVHYVRGAGARAKTESKVYSAAKPDFYRIYRVDLVSDVVRGGGADRATMVSVKASGPKLGALLDGNEKIVAITAIPSYSRMVYLPGP
jgi:hypothetical protein